MKLYRVLSICGLVMLAACGTIGLPSNITRGSGTLKTESRSVSGITAVELDTSGNLVIKQGETESLSIEAEDNLLPMLTSDVTGGVLKLSTKPNTGFSATKPITYTLMVKDITSLTVNGSGNASGETLHSTQLMITLTGSGTLTLGAAQADNLNITVTGSGGATITAVTGQTLTANLSGNGTLTLGGTVNDQTVTITGSGSYNGEALSSKTARVSSSGSGSAAVQVSDTLDASVVGSGSITYKGSPTVTQKRMGSGSITQKS